MSFVVQSRSRLDLGDKNGALQACARAHTWRM